MRAKRSKQYRKLMQQYELHFGFRPPYQVLLDDRILKDAANNKLNVGARLEDVLHSKTIKPMISQCCIRHLYNHAVTTDAEKRAKDSWIEVAKAAERRKCGHHELEEPLSTLECLESCVDPKGSGKNKHRYIVASQDDEVRRKMRGIAGVPLIYITHGMMILEPMSQASVEAKAREERGKVRAGLKGGRSAVDFGIERKREDSNETEDVNGRAEATTPKKRKVKGPKGPNPLSVKKPKDKQPKKSVAKEAEDERAVLRRSAKADPQVAEKALDVGTAIEGGTAVHGVTDGPRKRKRKRKPEEPIRVETVTGADAMVVEI